MASELDKLRRRVQALEGFVLSRQLPAVESGSERSISRVIVGMEHYFRTLVEDPPVKTSALKISKNSELGSIMDEKIQTATILTGGTPSTDAWWKSVLESKQSKRLDKWRTLSSTGNGERR